MTKCIFFFIPYPCMYRQLCVIIQSMYSHTFIPYLIQYFRSSLTRSCLYLFQIKTGAPCRSERLAKYNQILRFVLFHSLITLIYYAVQQFQNNG